MKTQEPSPTKRDALRFLEIAMTALHDVFPNLDDKDRYKTVENALDEITDLYYEIRND